MRRRFLSDQKENYESPYVGVVIYWHYKVNLAFMARISSRITTVIRIVSYHPKKLLLFYRAIRSFVIQNHLYLDLHGLVF